jgi:hypothetical protein
VDACDRIVVVPDIQTATAWRPISGALMIFTFSRTPVGLRVTSSEPVSEELLAMAGSSRLLAARMGTDATASFAVHLVTSEHTGMQTLEIGDRK